MGRHTNGSSTARWRSSRIWPVLFGAVALAMVIALGLWWWGLRDTTDPIDADPQRAYAVVGSSDPCSAVDAGTTVEFTVAGQTITTSLAGCGFKVGQRLAIQYLNSQPELIRLVGVTATPASSTAKRLLPLVILGIGFIAAAAAIALMRENRQGRRRLAAAKDSVTVAQMRAALAARQEQTGVASAGPTANAAQDSPGLQPDALSESESQDQLVPKPQLTKSLPNSARTQRSVTVIRVEKQSEPEDDIFSSGPN